MVSDIKVLNNKEYSLSHRNNDKDRSVFENNIKGIDKAFNSIPTGINNVLYDGFYSKREPKQEKEEIILENSFLETLSKIFSKDNQEEKEKNQENNSQEKSKIEFLSLSTQRKADITNARILTTNIFATASI